MNLYELLEELNKRARDYMNSGVAIETAQRQALQDFRPQVSGWEFVVTTQSRFNNSGDCFTIKAVQS